MEMGHQGFGPSVNPLLQLIVWCVAVMGLIVAFSTPYWAEYEYGGVRVHHGLWEVCVTELGTCSDWAVAGSSSAILVHFPSGLHKGTQVTMSLAMVFAAIGGTCHVIWLIKFTQVKIRIYAGFCNIAGLCDILAGAFELISTIVFGVAYKRFVMSGWCLWLVLTSGCSFICLSVAAFSHRCSQPPANLPEEVPRCSPHHVDFDDIQGHTGIAHLPEPPPYSELPEYSYEACAQPGQSFTDLSHTLPSKPPAYSFDPEWCHYPGTSL